ncbi:GNAT family N-acetyltransferase [Streptomyces sp. NPDC050617]|uniref:GNAT family N-acetyltransferase n=1 Tax=Streptomyces sp. NPDC050617 TaxID=3154628 RepID=UPI003431AD25
MVSFVDWNGLTAGQAERWRALYARYGTRVQQSPAYAEALHRAGERLLVAVGRDTIVLFAVNATTLQTVCNDVPILSAESPESTESTEAAQAGPAEPAGCKQLFAVLAGARRVTGLSVYAPLVAAEYAGVPERPQGEGFRAWPRPPNSVVDWSLEGADLWPRALGRGTSQLARKRRLVERDGLVLDSGRSGAAAARDMLAVDGNSWKAARGQSMRQRGTQSEVYGGLVRDGLLTVTFLRDGGRPVAFRLDGRVKDRLTCLKWSYDEAYRRYSPGLYLLTVGLTRQWSGVGIRTVDLFGGPDALKDLLYSARTRRADLWYGSPELGAERAAERRRLDALTSRAWKAGRGIRHAYG